MSVIQRPSKQGGATTYQGKVAAGYTKILASEVDADLDTIYSAWNTGVDTVNIRDGSITGAKLAAGAVGTRELADGGVATADLADAAVTTPKIADNAVTNQKVTSVSWSKLSGGAVASVPLTPRGMVMPAAGYLELEANLPGSASYDNTKPSYLVRADYTADSFDVYRAPPPGTAFVKIFSVSGTGVLTLPAGGNVALPALSVDRTEIAVNAIIGGAAAIAAPNGFVVSTVGVWTTVASLPSMTTRGGFVHLFANHCLSVTAPAAGGKCSQRWLRDGVELTKWSFLMGAASNYVPFPGISFIDGTAAAGPHLYVYQVFLDVGCAMITPATADGLFQAVEIG